MIRTLKPQWKEIGPKGVFEVGDFVRYRGEDNFEIVMKVMSFQNSELFAGKYHFANNVAARVVTIGTLTAYGSRWFAKAELSK